MFAEKNLLSIFLIAFGSHGVNPCGLNTKKKKQLLLKESNAVYKGHTEKYYQVFYIRNRFTHFIYTLYLGDNHIK